MTENIINEKDYTVILPKYTIEEEAYEWCNDQFGYEDNTWNRKVTQISGMTFIHSEIFYFDNEEDAVAFKLRWL